AASRAIPGVKGLLAYAGDILLVWLVLERIEQTCPQAAARHKEDSPDLWGAVSEQLSTARAYFGDPMRVLEKTADGLAKLSHKGHSAIQCVHDMESSNWLYDAVHTAIVEQFEIDEEEVAREAKRVGELLAALRSRHEAQRG